MTQIILRFLENELSENELKELKTWRLSDPENEKHFKETKFLWEKAHLTTTSIQLSVDKEAALAKVHSKITPPKVVPLRRNLVKWVAAMLIVTAGGTAYHSFFKQADIIQITTASNEQKEITLPDNSTVWMNENSELSYETNFIGKFRTVQMNGDVVFDVTPDKAKPFIVQSDQLKITVLGTKFNVYSPKTTKAMHIKDQARVHVLHGKVKVSSHEVDVKPVTLTKGMTAAYKGNEKELALEEKFSANSLFWQSQALAFKNQELREVIPAIADAYKINIEIADEKTSSCSFTGNFKKQSIEEVLEILKEVLKLDILKLNTTNYKIEGGLCK